MATTYILSTNGVDSETTFTSKAKACAAADKMVQAAETLEGHHTVEVRTAATSKVVYAWESPTAFVSVQDMPSEPDMSAVPSECFYGCGKPVTGAFCDYVGRTEGVCDDDAVNVHSSPVTLLPAVETFPVVGVVQDTPGMAGMTHYHSPECSDIAKEMKRFGQSERDVFRYSVAALVEIMEFEDGGRGSDYGTEYTTEWWNAVAENSSGSIRLMPCLGKAIPSGMCGDRPLIVNAEGNKFTIENVSDPVRCVRCGVHGDMSMPGKDMEDGHVCGFCLAQEETPKLTILDILPKEKHQAFADMAVERAALVDDGGFVETMVTKEYHLSVCVDEISGASVDLGWHAFTLNAAQAHDLNVIADAYGARHGSGKPRYGWASVITVMDVCDI